MIMLFNADEVFEMAEQIERNGAKFYRRAAEGAGDPHERDLLNELADWEETHQRVFAAIRAAYRLCQSWRTSANWSTVNWLSTDLMSSLPTNSLATRRSFASVSSNSRHRSVSSLKSASFGLSAFSCLMAFACSRYFA